MRVSYVLVLAASMLVACGNLYAQDDKLKQKPNDEDDANLMELLDDEEPAKNTYTTATFKTTRLVTGHSIENTGKGVLDFRVNHRFGALNAGTSTFEFFWTNNSEHPGYVEAEVYCTQLVKPPLSRCLPYIGTFCHSARVAEHQLEYVAACFYIHTYRKYITVT